LLTRSAQGMKESLPVRLRKIEDPGSGKPGSAGREVLQSYCRSTDEVARFQVSALAVTMLPHGREICNLIFKLVRVKTW
jgi:hypothetical protein